MAADFLADAVKNIGSHIESIFGKKKEEAAPKYTYDPNLQQYTAMKKGGMTASRRADGIAQRGKTRGKFV